MEYTLDDFNFTGYDLPRLVFLCKHQLMLLTRFPKLVVALYHHPCFAHILGVWPVASPSKPADDVPSTPHASHASPVHDRMVQQLVDSINRYAQPSLAHPVKSTIILDDALCTTLLQHLHTGHPRAKRCGGEAAYEHNVLRNVHHTLKQTHGSHTWTDTTHPMLELAIEAPLRRTRKRLSGGSREHARVAPSAAPVAAPLSESPIQANPHSSTESAHSLADASTPPTTESTLPPTNADTPSWQPHQARIIQIV